MLLSEVAIERSTFIVDMTFRDDRGDAVVPEAASWTLTDGHGNVVNSREDVVIGSPESTEQITLSGLDLQKFTSRWGELRALTVSWTYDSGKTAKELAEFYVRPASFGPTG